MQQAGLTPGHLPSLQDLQAMQARQTLHRVLGLG